MLFWTAPGSSACSSAVSGRSRQGRSAPRIRSPIGRRP